MKFTYKGPTPITPIMRRFALAVFLMAVMVILSGCVFFNSVPIARFSASVLTGTAPLLVSFDASKSYDLDGTIVSYHWDFGDELTATDITTSHTFTATTIRTFTVTLTVTDDFGATATRTQSIEVLPAESTGSNPPTARFTATPSYGNSPLTVQFDASLSYDADGTITVYAWDFGDDTTGSGKTISHIFTAVATTNITVTLSVTDTNGATGNTSLVVTAIVPVIVATDGPTASFTKSDPVTVYHSDNPANTASLFEVTFDPVSSTAASGHTLKMFLWNFGDGETLSTTTNATVKHIYVLSAPYHTFVATLTVIDEQGLPDSTVGNVTVVN